MPREEQKVNLVLLHKLMLELKIYLDFNDLKRRYEERVKMPIHETDQSKYKKYGQGGESEQSNLKVRHILKRFSVLNPSGLRATIQKCE